MGVCSGKMVDQSCVWVRVVVKWLVRWSPRLCVGGCLHRLGVNADLINVGFDIGVVLVWLMLL